MCSIPLCIPPSFPIRLLVWECWNCTCALHIHAHMHSAHPCVYTYARMKGILTHIHADINKTNLQTHTTRDLNYSHVRSCIHANLHTHTHNYKGPQTNKHSATTHKHSKTTDNLHKNTSFGDPTNSRLFTARMKTTVKLYAVWRFRIM